MHQDWLIGLWQRMRIGINGFGRIGRLVCRALFGRPGIEIVQINDHQATAESAAHLLCFDSVHGRWDRLVEATSDAELLIDRQPIGFSRCSVPADVPWSAAGVEMVLECSGRFKSTDTLEPYFGQAGIKRVVVGCPVKGALNIVYGINHHLYDPHQHQLVTAASCTTNCLAPIVKVVHEQFGIRHGSITTLHDVTNTQVVVDAFKADLRRSRSCLQSLIPTTTGSAKAIAMIFPELQGKLNGLAVRIPLLNASLTDAVFELDRPTSTEEVNQAFALASQGPLQGILGYETRPLVSVDYVNDDRSVVVDALSTMVVDGTQLKVYGWYDHEWGYSSRVADLVCHVVKLESERGM